MINNRLSAEPTLFAATVVVFIINPKTIFTLVNRTRKIKGLAMSPKSVIISKFRPARGPIHTEEPASHSQERRSSGVFCKNNAPDKIDRSSWGFRDRLSWSALTYSTPDSTPVIEKTRLIRLILKIIRKGTVPGGPVKNVTSKLVEASCPIITPYPALRTECPPIRRQGMITLPRPLPGPRP